MSRFKSRTPYRRRDDGTGGETPSTVGGDAPTPYLIRDASPVSTFAFVAHGAYVGREPLTRTELGKGRLNQDDSHRSVSSV